MGAGECLVLDLETQRAFSEVEDNRLDLLGVSLVGVYSYRSGAFETFREEELDALLSRLERASLIVGFNQVGFDFPVLQPYFESSLAALPTLDLLEEAVRALGHRVKLDDLAYVNLGRRKSGSGLDALEYYRSGRWDLLEKYCLEDVTITRDLFDYGRRNSRLFYPKRGGISSFPVNWVKYQEHL